MNNLFTAKSGWYFVAPNVSGLHHLIQDVTKKGPHRGMISRTMPELAKKLLTSRLKENLFSIITEENIDTAEDRSYSTEQESNFLLACCDHLRSSANFHGDETILLKSGSRTLVHRGEDGKVNGIVVVPANYGKDRSSGEILSTIKESKCESRTLSSDCTMNIDKHAVGGE